MPFVASENAHISPASDGDSPNSYTTPFLSKLCGRERSGIYLNSDSKKVRDIRVLPKKIKGIIPLLLF